MTSNEKMLARYMFKLRVYRSEGFAFENLFGEVMEYSSPAFQKIEPYGNQGDRGNDAYEKDAGRYYQVYAPKNPSDSKANAISKVKGDFADKLMPYWGVFCVPKEYIFVFNDKYHGSIFDIEKTLAELKSDFNLDDARVFCSSHLEKTFLGLSPDEMMSIVGAIPSIENTIFADYVVFGEVIEHILKTPPKYGVPEKLISPDFEEKITFNNLEAWGDTLRAKAREVWQVDEYLSMSADFPKQNLRDNLAGYYAESILNNYVSTEGTSVEDLRFTYIFEKIAPDHRDPIRTRLIRDAALVLMAKYFETCDIFEEPTNASAC